MIKNYSKLFTFKINVANNSKNITNLRQPASTSHPNLAQSNKRHHISPNLISLSLNNLFNLFFFHFSESKSQQLDYYFSGDYVLLDIVIESIE